MIVLTNCRDLVQNRHNEKAQKQVDFETTAFLLLGTNQFVLSELIAHPEWTNTFRNFSTDCAA